MSSPNDAPGDPYLRALVAIGAELSQIRAELQRQNGTLDTDGSTDTDDNPITCDCGAAFESLADAKTHARKQHKAPRGAELDTLNR